MRICARNDIHGTKHLTPGREYPVVGLNHLEFRVLDDDGEPVLFPRSLFVEGEVNVPGDWIWDRYGENEYYADPPELHAPGFYEDYFDGKEYALRQFDSYLRRAGVKQLREDD